MDILQKIKEIQGLLCHEKIDGWLIYDFQNRNLLAHEFLEMAPDLVITRRFFYWIPSRGHPVKLVHVIESDILDHLPGEKRSYLKWQTLEALLKQIVQGSTRVAMEYSPRSAIPYLSQVDGGVIDLLRENNVTPVSSGSLSKSIHAFGTRCS